MAKQQSKSKAPAPPTPYEMLGARIQKVINSPAAQKAKSAVIAKEEHEATYDWERSLGEVAENDNVTIAPRDDGSVKLTWTVPTED